MVQIVKEDAITTGNQADNRVDFDVDEVAELLAGLGEGADAEVSVSALNGRKCEWLFDFAAGSMSPGDVRACLRDEYGGGEFKIAVRKDGKFVSHRNISVRAPKGSRSPVPGQSRDGMAEVLMTIQQMQQQQSAQFQQMMMQMSTDTKQSQIEMMRLMIEKGGGSGGNLDVVQLLATAKELFSRKDDSLSLVLKGIELHKELSGEGAKEGGGLGDVLKTLGVPLASLIAAQQSAKQGRDVPQLPYESGDSVSNETNNQENIEEQELQILQKAKIQLAAGMFIKAAASGASVEPYVQIFCDQYADEVPDDFLLTEKFNDLYEWVPEAAAYKEWFEALRSGCVKVLFEESGDE